MQQRLESIEFKLKFLAIACEKFQAITHVVEIT
jgi:hypothetical protein